ncbi:MAG: ferrochelatase [Hyphomonadaceae bacterium]|nr:ferrochelatase [Hyphomonadaceae bacterium]
MRKVAIILCNLGGPDSPAAVRPFLFNLFNDAYVLALPQPFRALLAWIISTARDKFARANYAKIGGRSPLFPETQKQAAALEAALAGRRLANLEAKTFIAMRHWRPFTADAAKAAASWGATEAIVLPLYPQFSGATTASALAAWRKASRLPTAAVCCWSAGAKLARAHADAILSAWRAAGSPGNPRVLFSAHGLPERDVARGDPYQFHCERSVAAVRALLPADWDHVLCYQSRVGPLKWLGPSTDDEIRRAGADNRGLIVCPVAFVSEHIETLVELDIDYAELAHAQPLPFYIRAPAPGVAEPFIDALADLVEAALARPRQTASDEGPRLCPHQFSRCPHRAA